MAGRFLVGRQPIFDAGYDVVGYELLFRGDRRADLDDDAMTSEVLVRAALDLGLSGVVGDRKAFVNASRAFLVGDLELPLAPDRIVLEVHETVSHDPEVIAGCDRLAAGGFTIALEDYTWDAAGDGILRSASMAKVDILALSPDELADQVRHCRSHGLRLVAEKVETYEQLASCREMGFDLFQGYVLSRPQLLEGSDRTPDRLTVLRLIGKVCHPDTPTRELERIVESDAALSYRLLRVAAAGAGSAVRSVREGVDLLGRHRLRGWLVLMLACGADRSAEQVKIAMTRAKMCELLASGAAPGLRDSAFTVGLVSALDLLLQAPLEDVVADLDLDATLAAAVVERAGTLGRILSDVLDWELGRPPGSLHTRADLRAAERGYVEALHWTTNLFAALQLAS